jgi:DNA-binding NarL/FixJ family response regulator
VLLTLHKDPNLIQAAVEAGIRGYVLKFDAVENLVSAVHAALKR